MSEVNQAISTNYKNYMNYPLIYNNRYSTDEQVVGIWINGKPIYRRVFTCKIPENLPVRNSYLAYKYYNFNQMDTIVSLRGIMGTEDASLQLAYVLHESDLIQIYLSRKMNQFGIIIGETQLSQKLKYIHIVLEFTKVSDVATINPPIVLTNVYTGAQDINFDTVSSNAISLNSINGVNSIGSDALNIETAKEITE